MLKMFKRNVFISHSSNNREIAEQICAFLVRLGIDEDKVFCSSVIGQGINNGEKLNEAIATAIRKSKLIIFLLSYDFINSSYCVEELGVGWYLEHTNKAKCFYFVMPDIELSDLHGFVNSRIHKFSFLSREHQEDLSLFAENIYVMTNILIFQRKIWNLARLFLTSLTSIFPDTPVSNCGIISGHC